MAEVPNALNVAPNHDQFPVGLRILVVDHDPTVLKIFEQMAAQCHYHVSKVTTCNDGCVALSLLREKRDSFDAVISDIHMPAMDGYKFLQHVDQEFNLPVISMSADNSHRWTTEASRHGAFHHLMKPVQLDDIRNLWQHIIWKKYDKEPQFSAVLENNDGPTNKQGNNVNVGLRDDDHHSIPVAIPLAVPLTKKPRWDADLHQQFLNANADVGLRDHSIPLAKKPTFRWDDDLNQQFLNALEQLGDSAIPSKILGLMNNPNLTRGHISSHLQRHRLKLKKEAIIKRNIDINRLPLPDDDGSPQIQEYLDDAGNPRENHSNSNDAPHSPKHDANVTVTANHLMALQNASPSSGHVLASHPTLSSGVHQQQQEQQQHVHNSVESHTDDIDTAKEVDHPI